MSQFGLRKVFKSVLLIAAVVLLSCSEKFNEPENEQEPPVSEGLYGTLVFEDHTLAPDAKIFVWASSQGLISDSTGKVLYSAISNQEGVYTISPLPPGTYDYLAVWQEGFSRTKSVFTPGIIVDSLFDKGTDTLKETGDISALVYIGSSLQADVLCYVPHTPFYAVSDESGLCELKDIPAGEYTVKWELSSYVYESNLKIDGGVSKELADVFLVVDEALPPPFPIRTKLDYNPANGLVELSWEKVPVTDLNSYLIYRMEKDGSLPVFLNSGYMVTDTVFFDTLFRSPDDIGSRTFIYSVVSRDNNGAESAPAIIDTLTAIPPKKPSGAFPANGSGDVDISTFLFWDKISSLEQLNVYYRVLLGRDSSNLALVTEGLTMNFTDPGLLLNSTSYFWRVEANINGIVVPGPIWSFSTKGPDPDNNAPLEPYFPIPEDGAVDQALKDLVLNWKSGDVDSDPLEYDVYLSTDSLSQKNIATRLSVNKYSPIGLLSNTKYFWYVVVSDGKTTTVSPVWRFSTSSSGGNRAPYKPAEPNPENNAPNIGISLKLKWKGGDPDSMDEVKYALFLSKTLPFKSVFDSGLTKTEYIFEDSLEESTLYFWQVLSSDGVNAVLGDVWSFQTRKPFPNQKPNTPAFISPQDGQTNIETEHLLSWSGGDPDPEDIITYTVFLGKNNPPQSIIADKIDSNTFKINELDFNTEYFWYVIASDGKDSALGDVWHFYTIPKPNNLPAKPELIQPDNEAADRDTSILLEWRGSDPDPDDILTYRVKYGTAKDNMKLELELTDEHYTLGDLEFNTQYFWKIIVSDGKDAVASEVRSFSTRIQPSITIGSPDGGERWGTPGFKKITWTSTGQLGNIKVELIENGTAYTISEAVPDTGELIIRLPDFSSKLVKFRVSSSLANVSDESNNFMSIYFKAPGHEFSRTIRHGGEGDDISYSIKAGSLGSSAVCGSFKSSSVGFGGGVSVSNKGDADIFIASFKPDGSLNWVKGIGGEGEDAATDLVIGSGRYAGNIYVTGYFSSEEIDFGDGYTLERSGNSFDFFVAVYSNSGTCKGVVNAHDYYENIFSKGLGIAVNGYGDIFVTGNFGGRIDFNENSYLDAGSSSSIFVIKINASLSISWVRKSSGSENISAYDIAADNRGCYITGAFSGTGVNFGDNKVASSNGDLDMFVAAYDNNYGTCNWVNSAGGAGNDGGYALAVGNSGDCFVTGAFSGPSADISGQIITSDNVLRNVFTARYNSVGVLQWAQPIKKLGFSIGNGITLDDKDNCYIVGSFMGHNGGIIEDDTKYNVFTAAIGSQGDLSWIQEIGGAHTDKGFGIDYYNDFKGQPRIMITGSISGSPVYFNDKAENSDIDGGLDIFIADIEPQFTVVPLSKSINK